MAMTGIGLKMLYFDQLNLFVLYRIKHLSQ